MGELFVLCRSRQPLLQQSGSVLFFSVLYLGWFWCTLGWGLNWLGHRLAPTAAPSLRLRYPRLWSLGASVLLSIYVVSWGLLFATGQFLNVESLLFMIQNPPFSLWEMLTIAERIQLVVAAMTMLLLPWMTPRVLARLTRVRPQKVEFTSSAATSLRRLRQLAWGGLTFAVVCGWNFLLSDPSGMRLAVKLEHVKTAVHPELCLLSSTWAMLNTQPIVQCLDEAELRPISKTNWAPPAPNTTNRPSVIIVAMEAMRHDVLHQQHQGQEIVPQINQLARAGVEFRKAYAQSTHSDYADCCLVSSLYPLRTRHHHYYRTTDPWPKTLAFDLFKQAGYATALCSASNEGWGCADQFYETPNLDLFYDSKRAGLPTQRYEKDSGFAHEIEVGALTAGLLSDVQVMDKAINWAEQRFDNEQPFFLSIAFQGSHFPYQLPPGAAEPFQPASIDDDVSFAWHPPEKTPQVKNAYYNGLHHSDEQIGRLVEMLKARGQLDKVILIVLGENGESFHEGGIVGHGQAPVESSIHVATVIHAPEYLETGVNDYPLEHVDLMPTLMGLLGWPTHPNFQGIDCLSAQRAPLDERVLHFHVNSPMSHVDALQWAGRWKLHWDHRTGRIALFDLESDPGENHEVSQTVPEITARLTAAIESFRNRQLAFYHFPTYYQRYYPPLPLPLPVGPPSSHRIGFQPVSRQ